MRTEFQPLALFSQALGEYTYHILIHTLLIVIAVLYGTD